MTSETPIVIMIRHVFVKHLYILILSFLIYQRFTLDASTRAIGPCASGTVCIWLRDMSIHKFINPNRLEKFITTIERITPKNLETSQTRSQRFLFIMCGVVSQTNPVMN